MFFYYKSHGNPYQYCKSRENPYQYCKSRENPYQHCKSRENPYQVLQVKCTASEHAMGSYDKIIITIVPSYTRKNITRLLPLALLLVLRTCNNTDSKKLVIFSGIALYRGDTHLITNYHTIYERTLQVSTYFVVHNYAGSWSTASSKMKMGEAKGKTNRELVCSIQFWSNVSEWLLRSTTQDFVIRLYYACLLQF